MAAAVQRVGLNISQEIYLEQPIKWHSNSIMIIPGSLVNEIDNQRYLFSIDIVHNKVRRLAAVKTTAFCSNYERGKILIDHAAGSESQPALMDIETGLTTGVYDKASAERGLRQCAKDKSPSVLYENLPVAGWLETDKTDFMVKRSVFKHFDVRFIQSKDHAQRIEVHDAQLRSKVCEFKSNWVEKPQNRIDFGTASWNIRSISHDQILIYPRWADVTWREHEQLPLYVCSIAGKSLTANLPWRVDYLDRVIDIVLLRDDYVIQLADKIDVQFGKLYHLQDARFLALYNGPLEMNTMTVSPDGRAVAVFATDFKGGSTLRNLLIWRAPHE